MVALRRIACLSLRGGAREGGRGYARELLDLGLAHSPRVEEGGADFVYVDVAGLRGLFGDEREIGGRLLRAAAERGLEIRVGIAGSRIGALVAARRADGIAVVEPGHDTEYLASAALSFLDPSDEVAARVSEWGIRTLGDLVALPAASVFERLGSEGLYLQRLARGEDSRPLRAWTPPPVFEASIAPGWTVESMEALGDLLARLAARVCEKLTGHGLWADRFQWACRLSDRTVHEASCAPAVPVNEPSAVVGLLEASLRARRPRAAVEAVTLRAHPVRMTLSQESLIDRARPAARMLATTLARLVALVGEDRIGVPVLLDSHRPDAVQLAPLSVSSRPVSGEDAPCRGALGLRRLRPACPAGVTLTAGRPVHLRSERLTASIVTSAGPWRSSGEWWTERQWAHDEWDVELGDGTLCRLAHDGSRWWLSAIYD